MGLFHGSTPGASANGTSPAADWHKLADFSLVQIEVYPRHHFIFDLQTTSHKQTHCSTDYQEHTPCHAIDAIDAVDYQYDYVGHKLVLSQPQRTRSLLGAIANLPTASSHGSTADVKISLFDARGCFVPSLV